MESTFRGESETGTHLKGEFFLTSGARNGDTASVLPDESTFLQTMVISFSAASKTCLRRNASSVSRMSGDGS